MQSQGALRLTLNLTQSEVCCQFEKRCSQVELMLIAFNEKDVENGVEEITSAEERIFRTQFAAFLTLEAGVIFHSVSLPFMFIHVRTSCALCVKQLTLCVS